MSPPRATSKISILRAASVARSAIRPPGAAPRPTVSTGGWSGNSSQSWVRPSARALTNASCRRRPSAYGVKPRWQAVSVVIAALGVEPEQLRPLQQLAHAAQELDRQLAVHHAVVEPDRGVHHRP